MTKKKEKEPQTGDVVHWNGWEFHLGEAGTTGTKTYEPGAPPTDVAGKDLDDAKACATETDRILGLRAQGRAEQNKTRADAVRDHADLVEAGLI